jgi:hypothetical protein
MGSTPKGVPRPFLDSARWQHETGPWGTQPPHHQTGNADTEPGAPLSRPPQTARPADAIKHAHLTNTTTYQWRTGVLGDLLILTRLGEGGGLLTTVDMAMEPARLVGVPRIPSAS